MFEKATKQKIRFETSVGDIGVEDLWDLPLTSRNSLNLDTVARTVSKKLKETDDSESFVKPITTSNTELSLKLDIVKRIISVRLQEKEDRETRAEKKEKKNRILEIINKKQDQELESKSIDDLKKDLESL